MHREPDIPIEPDQGPPHPHRGTVPDPVEHEPDRDPSDPAGSIHSLKNSADLPT